MVLLQTESSSWVPSVFVLPTLYVLFYFHFEALSTFSLQKMSILKCHKSLVGKIHNTFKIKGNIWLGLQYNKCILYSMYSKVTC